MVEVRDREIRVEDHGRGSPLSGSVQLTAPSPAASVGVSFTAETVTERVVAALEAWPSETVNETVRASVSGVWLVFV